MLQNFFRRFPVGPKLWQWYLCQALTPWLIFGLSLFFISFEVAIAVYILIVISLTLATDDTGLLFFDDPRKKIQGVMVSMYLGTHLITALTVLLVMLVPYMRPVGFLYFIGKYTLTAFFWLLLPFTLRSLKNKLPRGWQTPIWDKTEARPDSEYRDWSGRRQSHPNGPSAA